MKVQQLIDELSELNPESEVIIYENSGDDGFSPLYCINSQYVYKPSSTSNGEAYHVKWEIDQVCMDEDEWETMKQMPRCVVLFPVN